MARRQKKAAGRRARERAVEPSPPSALQAEAIALGLIALGLFVEVALWSYSPADPWWAFGRRVENLCGPAGALVAAALAGALGLAAHVLPAACAVIALRYLRGSALRARWISALAWSVFWLALSASLEVGPLIKFHPT